MANYARWLWDCRGVGGECIGNYVSTLKGALRRGFSEPMPESVIMPDMLKVLRAEKRVPQFREPASDNLVASIVNDEGVDLGVRLAISMMWHLLLRVGAVTTGYAAQFDQDHTLLRRDCTIQDGKVCISVPHDKTDRHNSGSCYWLLPMGGSGCPVALFRRYWEATSHLSGEAPLLRRARDTSKLVTRAEVSAALKSHAAELGLDSRFISSHSLRVGAATALASAGLSMCDLLLAGRWVSEQSALVYLRNTLPRAKRILEALSLSQCFNDDGSVRRTSSASQVLSLRPARQRSG